jgi:exodeoxyribonuclease VII large subunit
MNKLENHVYQVHELSQRVKSLLEDEIGQVWVEGEISGFRPHASGHMYFDLKDAEALINVCLFKGSQRRCSVLPENGKQVRIFGDVSSYPRSSRYQVICRAMEEAGLGKLHLAFEKLKKKLAEEGLFDEEIKKALPLLPLRLGIVTSPSGAALQDMLNVLERRYSTLHIRIAPARVQGQGAAEEIAAGIETLNRFPDLDVIIIGRGGGSMEDLWAFNEEVVARAIHASERPVISAVGHETDFTISDFAADLRAPTPSAAAELVIGRKADFEEQVNTLENRLQRGLLGRVESAAQDLDILQDKLWMQTRHHIQSLRQRVSQQAHRLQQLSPRAQLKKKTEVIHQMEKRLHRSLSARLSGYQHRVLAAENRLKAMNPSQVLTRGYSITRTASGQVLRSISDVQVGEEATTLLPDGQITSTVTHTEEKTDDGK